MPQRRVLIVDDEPEVADLLREMAEMRGCEAYVARDGLEGIESARRYEPDVIFTDTNMPRLEGPAMASQLRETGYRGKICLMSGLANPTEAELRAYGTDTFLRKPFSLGDFNRAFDYLTQGEQQ